MSPTLNLNPFSATTPGCDCPGCTGRRQAEDHLYACIVTAAAVNAQLAGLDDADACLALLRAARDATLSVAKAGHANDALLSLERLLERERLKSDPEEQRMLVQAVQPAKAN